MIIKKEDFKTLNKIKEAFELVENKEQLNLPKIYHDLKNIILNIKEG